MLFKYFWLKQDRREQAGVYLPTLNDLLSMQDLATQNYSSLKKSLVIKVKPSKYNLYPDVLDQQMFLVKKWLRDLFLIYQPKMVFHTIYLMDDVHRILEPYYLPELPKINCLHSESVANLDYSVISELHIHSNAVKKEDLFQIANIRTCTPVISVALAESILRRNPNGLLIEKIYDH